MREKEKENRVFITATLVLITKNLNKVGCRTCSTERMINYWRHTGTVLGNCSYTNTSEGSRWS